MRRGLQIDPICHLCNEEIEDAEHLFLRCRTAQEVWRQANDHNWVTINAPSNFSHGVQNWLSSIRSSNPLVKMDGVVAHMLSIWKMRNDKIFCDEVSNRVTSLIRAKKASDEWRIRHQFTQTIQPPNLYHPTTNRMQTYQIA